MTVFCDNGDCCHIGEDGFCGCDKLSIVGGVCAGSYRSGRNACDGDVDERLKDENAKLIVKLNAEHIVRQNVEVENAKLRERVAELEELLPDSGRWYRAETVEAYVAEIAKLRELVQRMRRYMVDAVEHCGYDAQTTGYTMLGSRLEECEDAMRKLGMEVDEC